MHVCIEVTIRFNDAIGGGIKVAYIEIYKESY